MSKPLIELCDQLTVVVRELAEKRLDSREIVAEFRRRHARTISNASRDLEDKALVQLVSQVSRRRPALGLVPEGPDLFGYRVSAVVVVPRNLGGKPQRVLTTEMNERELKTWIAGHSQQRDEITEEVAEMSRLYQDVKDFFTTPDTTIAEAMASKHAKSMAGAAAGK